MTYDEHRNTVLFLSCSTPGRSSLSGTGTAAWLLRAVAQCVWGSRRTLAFGRSTLCLGMKPLVQADEESV